MVPINPRDPNSKTFYVVIDDTEDEFSIEWEYERTWPDGSVTKEKLWGLRRRLALVPVHDDLHNDTYEPPKKYEGKPAGDFDLDAYEMAKIGLEKLKILITEGERFVDFE